MHLYVFILQSCVFIKIYALSPDDFGNNAVSTDIHSRETTKLEGRLNSLFLVPDRGHDKAIPFSFLRKKCCYHQYYIVQDKGHAHDMLNGENEGPEKLLFKHIIHKKPKYMPKIYYFNKESKYFKIYSRSYHERISLLCRKIDNLKFYCDNLLLRKQSDLSHISSIKHRKLLQVQSRSDSKDEAIPAENIRVWLGGINEGSYTVRNTSFNGLSVQQWKDFLEALNRKMSKDHVWAMLSLVFLIVALMTAMKVCGLKAIDRSQERNLDYVFHGNDHTVSIKEILALKRPYLPKELVRFSKRWRRKRKKRFFVKPIELDVADPISDNSDDERLIYSQRIIDF